MATFEYVKKRLASMASARQTWEDHWQEILDYVMPRKAEVTFIRAKGEKRTEILFDSTAITANNLLAASLQGTLTSPSLQWFYLKIISILRLYIKYFRIKKSIKTKHRNRL